MLLMDQMEASNRKIYPIIRITSFSILTLIWKDLNPDFKVLMKQIWHWLLSTLRGSESKMKL